MLMACLVIRPLSEAQIWARYPFDQWQCLDWAVADESHDRNVPIWLGSPAAELIFENGRAVGAVIEKEGKTVRVEARRGVLLAAGGFERNLEMRKEYGPSPASVGWTAGNEDNTGDAIQMGMKAGAGTALMSEAWWTPVTQYPGTTSGWVLVVEKSLPGGIFINGAGKRFTNESAPYVDVVVEMYKDHQKTGNSVPGWMVFDANYRHNYIAGPVGPGKALPDSTLPRKLRKDFLVKASSLDELAQKLGVAPQSLQSTVTRFNEMAKTGKDLDFGRGESASDRYYGDARVKPNPCMAPIDKAPYYAIPLFPGDLGTKGGLLTDAQARVLRDDGEVIAGLYAAGNSTASVMGRTYPGAGGTIGPALCYGFLAAVVAARAECVSTEPEHVSEKQAALGLGWCSEEGSPMKLRNQSDLLLSCSLSAMCLMMTFTIGCAGEVECDWMLDQSVSYATDIAPIFGQCILPQPRKDGSGSRWCAGGRGLYDLRRFGCQRGRCFGRNPRGRDAAVVWGLPVGAQCRAGKPFMQLDQAGHTRVK